MDFKELGAIFRRERERRGLSKQAVVMATRISTRNLEALEQGELERLPHPVYAKGFVRNYAKYLGMDAEEMVRVVEVELSGLEEGTARGMSEALATQPPQRPDMAPVNEKKSTWPTVLLLLVLVGVLAWLIFSMEPREPLVEEGPAETTAPAAVPTDQATEAVPPTVPPTDTPSDATPEMGVETGPGPDAAAPEVSEPAPESASETDATVDSAVQATPEESVAATVRPEVAAPAAQQPQAGEGVRVFSLKALDGDASWMEAWVDDGPRREYLIADGEGVRFEVKEKIMVRLGNAGGVRA